ncbi:MAG: inorganic phosphate transporter [Puniceicoccales bacterium]|jgi:PiT family inorganic phosphate transporter|nr:inorganic phosphate transporter [Puniceicoccales bacterium]
MIFVLILAAIGAIFVAFNNGANDVANAFASAVGSKALKIKHALLIAAVLNFFGAILLGSNVSKTLVDGVVNISHFNDVNAYVAGMLACMIAAGSFIFVSTRTGLPVSSTHAIVGGMIGIATTLGGLGAVKWKLFSLLTISWICTPFLAAACSLITIKLIKLTIYRGESSKVMQRACNWIPLFASVVTIAIIIAIMRGSGACKNSLCPHKAFWILLLVFPVSYVIFRTITKRLILKFKDREFGVEHVFRRFQAGTSCLIGFAVGSNDVANSITPVVAIYFVAKLGMLPDSFANYSIPIWMLAVGGLGMSMGVLSLGHKVIDTMGHSITLLSNSKGFSVDFSTATTIILASVFGMPVSSTHAATGAVIGVGLEKGLKGLNLRLLFTIFVTWLLTVPISALFTILVYFILRTFMLPLV